MNNENAKNILLKYQAGTASAGEKALVEDWMLYAPTNGADLTEIELLQDLLEIRQRLNLVPAEAKTIRLWPRIVAAAAVLLFLSVGIYLIVRKQAPTQIAVTHDVAPGSNKAILVLAGGKSIILNDAKNGTLAQQGGAAITKTADGEVVYSADKANPNAGMQLNTIVTPRGGQYHLVLADGSNVWLNAASSIKYPVAFTGKDREVEITGEAYFEVAHNAAKPFRVRAAGQTVEVLGTHFNINAYADEASIKTTLLEGSVKVADDGEAALLKPGQQSQINNGAFNHNISIIKDVDTEEVVAWKNGLFQFNNENLADIMRKVSRWYDVDVTFTNKALQSQPFSGTVSKFKTVSQLLRKLELTGSVHFKVEGQKITVNN